jgi:DNA-3-methyladenine glycosylase
VDGELTLPRRFFERHVTEVAPDLLGTLVERHTPEGVVAVRLTEVEAYDGENDPGSHAFRGRTARNATMFGAAGHVYVYFTYGMHWCMNVVCGPVGRASAVLLRAGEVVEGVELARLRRPGVRRDTELARGPARLTRTLAVDRSLNGVDALDPAAPLRLLRGACVPRDRVVVGPRVGVAGAGAPTPWRYAVADDPTVSAYRPAVRRTRRPA